MPKPLRSALREHGITTLYRLGGELVAPVPRRFVRQLGLVAGQLVAWSDVGQDRLLVRKAEVVVHGSREVRPD